MEIPLEANPAVGISERFKTSQQAPFAIRYLEQSTLYQVAVKYFTSNQK
jgi:hypothetical protein